MSAGLGEERVLDAVVREQFSKSLVRGEQRIGRATGYPKHPQALVQSCGILEDVGELLFEAVSPHAKR